MIREMWTLHSSPEELLHHPATELEICLKMCYIFILYHFWDYSETVY